MLSPLAEAQAAASRPDGGRDRRHGPGATSSGWSAREREVDWVSGACLLVRRDAAVAAGLFDERYFLYEEDVDFCAALRARGGRVLFTPQAEIVHLRGRSRPPATGARRVALRPQPRRVLREAPPGWAPWLRGWLRLRGRSIR